jgi:ankyrin repeat protein
LRHLHRFSRLRLEPDFDKAIQLDVERYIDARMDDLDCSVRRKPKLGELRRKIKEKLVQGANGTYLLVKFAMNALQKERCPDLEAAVGRFPQGLDAMYRRMLLSIWGPKRSLVIHILQWVATAFRPLTLKEIGAALSLEPALGQDIEDAVEDFVRYAGDLLTPVPLPGPRRRGNDSPVQKIVVLVHSSVTDFLWNIKRTENDPELSEFRLRASKCHKQLASRTLDYTFEVLSGDPEVDIAVPGENVYGPNNQEHGTYIQYPLLQYSLLSSLRHSMKSQDKKQGIGFSHDLFDLEQSAIHSKWLCFQSLAIGLFWSPPTVNLLHISALLGYTDILRQWPRYQTEKHPLQTMSIEVEDEHARMPIFYAVMGEQEETVAFLLAERCEVNATDIVGQLPIHIASASASQNILTALVDHGADVNCLALPPVSTSTSNEVEEAVSMLDDDRKMDMERDDALREGRYHSSGYPLHFAAEYKLLENMCILLSKGADVSSKDVNSNTALHRVAQHGKDEPELIRFLAENGAELLATNGEGENALHMAAVHCDCDDPEYEDAVRTLVTLGVPVDSQTIPTESHPGGKTALHVACEWANSNLVDWLIKQDADVNRRDGHGWTALHWVNSKVQQFVQTRPRICRTLLRAMSQAAIYAKNAEGKTALTMATEMNIKYHEGLRKIDEIDEFMRDIVRQWRTCAFYEPLQDIIRNKLYLIETPGTDDVVRTILTLNTRNEEEKGEESDGIEKLLQQRRDYRATLGV